MPSEKQIVDAFDKVASDMPGFMAASLVDLESGMTLGLKSIRPDFDLAAASAYNSEMVKQKLKIMKALNLKTTLEDMLITLGDQIHVIKLVGPTTFIYLVRRSLAVEPGDRAQRARQARRELHLNSTRRCAANRSAGDHDGDDRQRSQRDRDPGGLRRPTRGGQDHQPARARRQPRPGRPTLRPRTPTAGPCGSTGWSTSAAASRAARSAVRSSACRASASSTSGDAACSPAPTWWCSSATARSARPRERSRYLFELRDMLAAGGARAPVGVILQANKRDLPDAIPLDELRAAARRCRLADRRGRVGRVRRAPGSARRSCTRCGSRSIACASCCSAARCRTAATGPRSAERAARRAARRRRRPARGPGDRGRARRRQPGRRAAPRGAGVRSRTRRRRSPIAAPPTERRARPTPRCRAARSGRRSRAARSSASSRRSSLAPRRLSNGDWAAGLGSGWRVVSSRDAAFASLDQGRTALIQWARLHAGAAGAISPRRCIVLADDGDGELAAVADRARRESLREPSTTRSARAPARRCWRGLRQAAQLLLDADDGWPAGARGCPATSTAIGTVRARRAVYIGLMPGAADGVIGPRPRRDPRSLLRAQLEPVIAARAPRARTRPQRRHRPARQLPARASPTRSPRCSAPDRAPGAWTPKVPLHARRLDLRLRRRALPPISASPMGPRGWRSARHPSSSPLGGATSAADT